MPDGYEFGARAAAPGTQAVDVRVTAFLKRVCGWMFLGLAVTTVVAFFVASTPAVTQAIWGNRMVFWLFFAGELGLVWYLSARVAQLEPAKAGGLFTLYSALNGVTLSIILLAYTGASIATAFLTATGMFGALALYGTVTKRSLAGVGQFAMMGLFGLVIATIVGLFWQNDMLQFLISVVGVIVFTGLTAWDSQRLRMMALQLEGPQVGSYAVVGALALYLDFINLFLFLLRFMGRRR
jgi:FtsH-binding integral membrane protein